MAKLDFFVRYPQFFASACEHLGKPYKSSDTPIDSEMIRHHYGPWDSRYYHILGYLESRDLINVTQDGATILIGLTPAGVNVANALSQNSTFANLVEHMRSVKKAFGNRKGDSLKKLIYELFDAEVASLEMGESIRP